MKTIEEFVSYVSTHILEHLPETYADYEVSTTSAIKNNGVLLGWAFD